MRVFLQSIDMAMKFDQVELINLQYCKVSYINLGVIFISEHFRWTNIQGGRISGGNHEQNTIHKQSSTQN